MANNSGGAIPSFLGSQGDGGNTVLSDLKDSIKCNYIIK